MKRTRERERGTKEETRSERESPPQKRWGGGRGQEATSKAHTKRRLEEEKKKAETGDTGKTKKEGGDKMRER